MTYQMALRSQKPLLSYSVNLAEHKISTEIQKYIEISSSWKI